MVVGLFCGTVRRGGRDDWIHAVAIARFMGLRR
jgi:hypothetical protein